MNFFVFMLMIFVPLMIHQLMQVIKDNRPTVYIDIVPEYTYEDIKTDAIYRAANGDSAARNWVMKHVYNDSNTTVSKRKTFTSQHIIDDAISALVALGDKKSVAKNKVNAAVGDKTFNSVQSLLNEIFKK